MNKTVKVFFIHIKVMELEFQDANLYLRSAIAWIAAIRADPKCTESDSIIYHCMQYALTGAGVRA